MKSNGNSTNLSKLAIGISLLSLIIAIMSLYLQNPFNHDIAKHAPTGPDPYALDSTKVSSDTSKFMMDSSVKKK